MKRGMLLVMLLLAAGLARADGECGRNGKLQEGSCAREDQFTIASGLSFGFLTTWPAGPQVTSAQIRIFDAGQPLQTLEQKDMSSPELSLRAEDANFDGFLDLLLLIGAGATGNTNYMLWLFDTGSRSFIAVPKFQELFSPSFDAQAKLVRTHNKGGNAGLSYVDTDYRWKGASVYKVAEESQDELGMPGFFRNIRLEAQNGRPEVVSDRIFSVNGAGDETRICAATQQPSSCGPVAAVIDFTGAEAARDAAAMVGHYAPEVTWQGAPQTPADLKANHQKWLTGLSDYTLGAENFRFAMSEDGQTSIVRCDVTGQYQDSAGKAHSFKIAKQFRLRRTGEQWLIECEEVARFLDGTRGKTSNACRFSAP